nr:MAG TPA: hypothetical protein [Caudoviricetes sp.]
MSQILKTSNAQQSPKPKPNNVRRKPKKRSTSQQCARSTLCAA